MTGPEDPFVKRPAEPDQGYAAPSDLPTQGTPPPGYGQPPQYGEAPGYGEAPQYGEAPPYGQAPQYGQAPGYGAPRPSGPGGSGRQGRGR